MKGARSSALALVLAMGSLSLSGCGKVEVAGRYVDAAQPGLVYEFRADGTWTAVWERKVPMGMFAQGAARRLGGVYELRGRRVFLTCRTVEERDPVSVGFVPVGAVDGEREALHLGYDHGFEWHEGRLRPLETDHPFGGGELVPVGDVRTD